jgi:hypothetical protein
VIFFGLIGSLATMSVDSVRDSFRADLTAAGAPPFGLRSITNMFEACFTDRANAKDFSVMPQSCQDAIDAEKQAGEKQPALAQQINTLALHYGAIANQRNFTSSITRTLWWEIGALAVIFVLSFLLPPRPRPEADLAAAGVAAG